MKIYGYSNNTTQAPMELNEVTVSASPELLREMAEFLEKCAKGIEDSNEEWNHEYFESKHEKTSDSPQLIVFNPNAS